MARRRVKQDEKSSLQLRLALEFVRISPTHHRLTYRRPDRSAETLALESKSCLEHDLLHLALESEVGLRKSFYGLLAAGHPYDELSAGQPDGSPFANEEAHLTELIVGPLTGYVRGAVEANAVLDALDSYLPIQGFEAPSWLNAQSLARVRENFRQLLGRWKATPFGQVMEVSFDL